MSDGSRKDNVVYLKGCEPVETETVYQFTMNILDRWEKAGGKLEALDDKALEMIRDILDTQEFSSAQRYREIQHTILAVNDFWMQRKNGES